MDDNNPNVGENLLIEKSKCLVSLEHNKNGHRCNYQVVCKMLTMLKFFTAWITTSCGKFLKRWEYHTTLPEI